MKKILLILPVIIISLVSCGTPNNISTDTIKNQNTDIHVHKGEIQYSDENISFVYPDDWLLTNEKDPVNESEVIVVTNTNAAGAPENFTFVVHDYAASSTDFKTFVQANVENIESQITLMDGKKVSQMQGVVNGKNAQVIEYLYRLDGEMVHSYQYYMNYNGRGYIITTTTSPNEEESSMEVFDRLFASFVINK